MGADFKVYPVEVTTDGAFKFQLKYQSGGLYMDVVDDKSISAWSDLVTSVDFFMYEADIHKSECPAINWFSSFEEAAWIICQASLRLWMGSTMWAAYLLAT